MVEGGRPIFFHPHLNGADSVLVAPRPPSKPALDVYPAANPIRAMSIYSPNVGYLRNVIGSVSLFGFYLVAPCATRHVVINVVINYIVFPIVNFKMVMSILSYESKTKYN